MIRRLMTGVFNPKELENVTASGQVPNRRVINGIITQRITELKLQNKHNSAIASNTSK